jgi:hypothetical protein
MPQTGAGLWKSVEDWDGIECFVLDPMRLLLEVAEAEHLSAIRRD